jgi:hypothetical protein
VDCGAIGLIDEVAELNAVSLILEPAILAQRVTYDAAVEIIHQALRGGEAEGRLATAWVYRDNCLSSYTPAVISLLPITITRWADNAYISLTLVQDRLSGLKNNPVRSSVVV